MFVGEGGLGKVDNPLVHMVSTCMSVVGIATGWDSLCCMGGHCAGGRCGGHGCGRNIGSGGSCGRSRRKTGWHIWLSAQTTGIEISVVEMVSMSVEIMMASISFVIQSLELIDLFCFNLLMSVLFDSVDE